MQTDDGAKSRNKSSKRPPFSDMIVEAIRVDNSKKGTTIPFIKTYLKDTYMVTDVGRLIYSVMDIKPYSLI